MADVDHFRRLPLDDRGAENALLATRDLDVETLLDDVDDLVDHESHRAAVVGEHQDRLRAFGADRNAVHLHQRHELLAILHHVAAVGELDLVDADLLETRDERKRHRLGLL